MTRRRVAAAVLLCAASTLPLNHSAVVAQDAAGELGFFDSSGMHLQFGTAFADAQRRESREVESRRRDYERCRNPSGGGGARLLGFGLGILAGRRGDFRQLLRPQRPAEPRPDCGDPPASAEAPASIRIVDANPRSDGRYGLIGQVVFRKPGDNLVADTQSLGGRCVALMDGAGHLVPVRSRSDPDPYGFANPYAANPVVSLDARASRLRIQIAERERSANSAHAILANSPAFDARAGACVTPAGQPIPPRPPAMTDAEIEDQAAGSCLDIMTRRQDPAKVLGAIRSVRWDYMIASMRRYQSHPASCASGVPSQTDDFAIRVTCSVSDIACYGHMQNVIQQCMAAVRSSCGAPLQAWRQRVNAINAGPAAARAQCESTKLEAESSSRDIAALRAELQTVEADLSRARAMPMARSIPISQARCGG